MALDRSIPPHPPLRACLKRGGAYLRSNTFRECPWCIVFHQSLWQQRFSSISTRMMSSPIWRMQFQGITYSLSLPKRQKQKRPGPGTIKAVIQPFSQLNSTSTGQPRIRQVQMLITSFCFNSQIRMKNTCFL